MALDTFDNLQNTVIGFSHRADLNALIPDFIRLAEDSIYAYLDSKFQDEKSTLSTVASQESLALPTDFMEFRSVAISLNSNVGVLTYLTPDQFQNQYNQQAGMPNVYTIVNSYMYLRPIPDAIYTLSIVYEAKFASLSSANQTNWILTRYPSIYLYAALEQLAIYIKEDSSLHMNKWQTTANAINIKDWNDTATMQVKTDVNLSQRTR